MIRKLFAIWTNGMSLLPDLMNKTVPATEAASIGAGRPFSARKALLVWIALMLAAWLLLSLGAYAFIGPGV
jgi:hypothetical protein